MSYDSKAFLCSNKGLLNCRNPVGGMDRNNTHGPRKIKTSYFADSSFHILHFSFFILHFSFFFVPLQLKYKEFEILIEKHIVLEDIDPMVFYGVGNAHLQMVKALYPKLRIVARDNVLRVLGDEEQMAQLEESVERMRLHVLKYNSITEEDILDIVKGRHTA